MTIKPSDLVATVEKDVRQVRASINARRSSLDETIASAERAVEQAQVAAGTTDDRATVEVLARWWKLATDAAPGAASAPWKEWPETESEPAEGDPSLYRIGSMSGQVPGRDTPVRIAALLPLLDAAHLRITGSDLATADAIVASLLVRVGATTRPSSVRSSLYDPRRLGAGLVGFHALSRSGLLTVYGVEEFKDLLSSLDREIRRIQRDVLG